MEVSHTLPFSGNEYYVRRYPIEIYMDICVQHNETNRKILVSNLTKVWYL